MLVSHSAREGVANVWDLRTARPTHHLECSDDRILYAALGVAVDSTPFVFTGGADEGIKAWDLRKGGRPLYELSTGNTVVRDLQWIPANSSLIAATVSCYQQERGFGRVDGNGWRHDMSTLLDLRRGYSMHNAMLHQKLCGEEPDFERRHADLRPDGPEGWPARAVHARSDFHDGKGGEVDVGGHALLQYRFSGAMAMAPPSPPAAPSTDGTWAWHSPPGPRPPETRDGGRRQRQRREAGPSSDAIGASYAY